MQSPARNFYRFGDFRIDADEKVLWSGREVVDVTPKAIDILLILVENAGRIVSKEEIFRRVWADSFVEEANLSHHIFRLRKALGSTFTDEFIETVPKRGYRLVAPMVESSTDGEIKHESVAPAVAANQPYTKVGLIAASVAILLIVAAAFTWMRRDPAAASTSPPDVRAAVNKEQQSIKRVTDTGKYAASTISPDGKFIAFVQNSLGGEGMLYIRQLDTTTERELLAEGERNFGAINFSPDSSFIYYIQYDKTAGGVLYKIPVLGGQPVKVLSDLHLMFNISPDGRKAAFFRRVRGSDRTSIVIASLDRSGDEQVILNIDDKEKAITSVPAFSPDGRLISFGLGDRDPRISDSQRFSLFTVDIQTAEVRPLTSEKWAEIGKTVWMPDGSGLIFPGTRPRTGNQIYFLSYPDQQLSLVTNGLSTFGNYGMGVTADGSTIAVDLFESSAQVWSIPGNGDTSGAEQITSGSSDGVRGLTALTDGRVIYSSRNGEDHDLWQLTERDGRREGDPLTSDAFIESELCATPDNRYLIFSSDRAGGAHHLFRMSLDSNEIVQLTSGDGIENLPDCSSDGSVIYNSHFNGQTLVWKIPVEGGTPVKLTDYTCFAPSISPDAASVACIIPPDNLSSNAVIAIVPSDTGGEPVKTFPVAQFAWYYRPVRWTPDSKDLLFIRSVKQAYNLWKQSLSGGEPKAYTDFKSDIIFNYVFARDGKSVIASRGKRSTNLALIKNFK